VSPRDELLRTKSQRPLDGVVAERNNKGHNASSGASYPRLWITHQVTLARRRHVRDNGQHATLARKRGIRDPTMNSVVSETVKATTLARRRCVRDLWDLIACSEASYPRLSWSCTGNACSEASYPRLDFVDCE
jgi:hypothetical protein